MIRPRRTVTICLLVGAVLSALLAIGPGPAAIAGPVAADPTTGPGHAATPVATPDPYAGLTVDALTARTYGGGDVHVVRTLSVTAAFTRTLITYPSDGLTVYGFMDTPKGAGPFPVIIAVHGYIDPANYKTLDYTTRYADALATAGFIVLHPNLRGYPPSDAGPNLFRTGFAVDVLNLIAVIRQQAGQSGPLEQANPEALGLWGHSMGGGVSLRVITISRAVKATVLYGAMSGDERKNYERIALWSGSQRGQPERSVPDATVKLISPGNYLDRILGPVSINHGEADQTVPPQWSSELCTQLQALHKTVECFTYPGEPHTFTGQGDKLFIERTISFFDKYLKNR